ncbi:gliding motility protein GldN [Flavisolibacter ginsenosidimutans]|uniref:Gliding motility protein GldN n=1 Tax=Flavisolibacter ginsenosidimutans TaxID=661481 RepID=A0A5B8UMG2_9BACT|nr:gliding motility protein GldN [Flavisolibacter ginsenosidimutans]QEC57758.1 gliding motility protein GldN [Flavisolibacter ginsenosidimutans]
MKSRVIKFCLFAFSFGLLVHDAKAQRRPRNSTSRDNGNNASTGAPTQQNNNTSAPTNFSAYGKLPVEVDSSGAGSTTGSGKSMRPDNAFGFKDSILNERTPLPYEFLRLDDALYAETVWRELDLREKMNQTFNFKGQEDNGDQNFISILLKAVQDGKVTAFDDERFTTPLALPEVAKRASGGTNDTIPVYDLQDASKIKSLRVVKKNFNPDDIKKFRIKEQWIFDREISRMVCRIIGIAPLKTEYVEGTRKELGSSVMFWVYYPDLRPTLARYEVYNAKNMGAQRMTWEELFESRMFSSYVTKSTLDNPGNKTIRQMIKDPILALLEGDNIKDRIFNYEQDLWSY